MPRIIVWDLPTRMLHWAFAGTLTAALALAFFADDDSVLFQFHMVFGLSAAFILLLRALLGLWGSRFVRFTGFPVRPKQIATYFADVVRGGARRYVGHNPGSALAALAMFVLVAALVITGVRADVLEDAHGILAYLLLGVIVAHLAGLVVHTIRHRENIAASMVTGRYEAATEEGLRTAHPIWGAIVALLGLAWIIALFGNHDAQAAVVRLPVVGTVVHLGDQDEESRHDHEEHHGEADR